MRFINANNISCAASKIANILNILKIVPCCTHKQVCSSVPPDRRGPQAVREAASFHLGGWPDLVEMAHCRCKTIMFRGLLPGRLYKMTGSMLFMQYHTPTSPLPASKGGGILMTSLPGLLFKEVGRSAFGIHDTHCWWHQCYSQDIHSTKKKKKARRQHRNDYATGRHKELAWGEVCIPSLSELVWTVH